MRLSELKRGQSVRIVSVNPSEPGVVRLMVLGLIEGVTVHHQNAAIGGDPMEVVVFGAAISIRKEQASQFSVELVTNDD